MRKYIMDMDLENSVLFVVCLFTLVLPITLIFIIASIAMALEDCVGKVIK